MEPVRITLQECLQLLEQGKPIQFIDVREPSAWEASDLKLPGALRIHPDEVDLHLADVRRDACVVPYCNTPREALSLKATRILKDHGFTTVFPLSGGFDRWLESDAPMEPRAARTHPARVPSQPNVVIDDGAQSHTYAGRGPTGERKKGRD